MQTLRVLAAMVNEIIKNLYFHSVNRTTKIAT